MGIVNRTQDPSEQYELLGQTLNATTSGKSDAIARVPWPATIIRGTIEAVGLSGSPTEQLKIKRFVVGAGETFIALGAALAAVATSTSGPQSYTFSTTALQAGDSIVATHAGSNAGLEQLQVKIVVQCLQDIRSWTFS